MTEQIFPSQLAEDMYDNNTKFETILHIPTLNVSDRVPEAFEDFLSSMDSKNAQDLIEAFPEQKWVLDLIIRENDREYNEEHACNITRYFKDFEFLVLLETAIPYNFKFNNKGEYTSNSIGGRYYQDWIFAKNMQDAAEQAIQISEKIRAKEEQKARKEQGLEA